MVNQAGNYNFFFLDQILQCGFHVSIVYCFVILIFIILFSFFKFLFNAVGLDQMAKNPNRLLIWIWSESLRNLKRNFKPLPPIYSLKLDAISTITKKLKHFTVLVWHK